MFRKIFFSCVCITQVVLLFACFLSCGTASSKKTEGKDTVLADPIRSGMKIKNDTCLIYFEQESDKSYTCCIMNLLSGDTVHAGHFKTTASEMLIDTARNLVYFFMEDGIFSSSYDSTGSVQRISDPINRSYILDQAWIDSTSNRIRFSYLVLVNDFTQQQKEQYGQLSKKTPDLPEDGLECLAYIAELAPDGKFSTVEQAAGKTGAFTYTGFEEIHFEKFKTSRSGIISRNAEHFSATCYKQSFMKDINFIDPEKYSEYGIEKYTVSPLGGFKYIITGFDYDIIVNTIFGDTPHYSLPVLAYNKTKRTATELKDINFDQIAIILKGNYLLFAEEYQNNKPIIYNWKTQQLLYNFAAAENAFILCL